ncbi:hypothetical protein COCCADRAFT_88324, partial [Bipolaris zeicola 26-R-13]
HSHHSTHHLQPYLHPPSHCALPPHTILYILSVNTPSPSHASRSVSPVSVSCDRMANARDRTITCQSLAPAR